MIYQLIQFNPLRRVHLPVAGFPPRRTGDDPSKFQPPAGYGYVPVLPKPDYDSETQVAYQQLTAEADGWRVIDRPVPVELPPMELPVIPESSRARFDRLVREGFDTGLGYRLALADGDRAAFAQMLLLVMAAMQAGVINEMSPQVIADSTGATHEVTTALFTGLMLQYGACYKGLWDAFKAGETPAPTPTEPTP